MADNDYGILREQIEGLLQEGQQFGRRAAEWEKVETYWHIGDALTRYLEAHGEETIRNLSQNAHLGLTTLYEILRFRQRVNALYARTNLGWSHYRALIHVPEDRLQHYEKLADEQGWTTRQLKRAIETETEADVALDEEALGPDPKPLRARFGEPFTRCWTYLASVRRIIDGDTLDVTADLGCGHSAPTRLRLRGIDTAELYTESGRRARQFVEDALETVALSRSANSLDLHLGTFHAGPGACCLAEPRSTAFPGCFPGQS